MEKTLIIGANGQIGKLASEFIHKAGIPVRAMVRSESQRPYFENQGIESVVGDLEGEFKSALEGCSQIIFTAGSGSQTGPDKTLLVDLHGAMRAVDYGREMGCKRFIMVSALRAQTPLAGPEKLRPYLVAKKAADYYLRTSGLPFVILRPGRLTDEPANGLVRLSRDTGQGFDISRANTALCLLEILKRPDIQDVEIDLLDGHTPVGEALEGLAG